MRTTRSLLLLLLCSAGLVAGCGRGVGSGGLDALLEEGWRAYSTGDFDVAINCFRAADNSSDATPEQAFSAVLGLATTHHFQANPDLARARDCYRRLGLLDTDAARRQSLLGLGQVDVAEGKTLEGQSRLVKLIGDYPDSVEADEAVIHLADSLFRPSFVEGKPGDFKLPGENLIRRGLNALEGRLKARPHNPLAAAMHMMLANAYVQMEDFDRAVAHLVAAEEEGIAVVKTRGTVLWRIARIAEKELGDRDLAEAYYERYVEEFGRTTLFYRALKSLERVRALKEDTGA